jgi:hypothetical protein
LRRRKKRIRNWRRKEEEETDVVSEHNVGETKRGAPPEELVERKIAISDVVEKKGEQRGTQTWPGCWSCGL